MSNSFMRDKCNVLSVDNVIINTFEYFMGRKNEVFKKNITLIITDVPLANVIRCNGVSTFEELYVKKEQEITDFIKAKIFSDLLSTEPTYTPMYEIRYI